MTNLEFINKEIEGYEYKIKQLKKEQTLNFNYENKDGTVLCNFEIEECQNILNILKQIKNELEAWEVVKTFLTDIGNEYVLSVDSYYNKEEYNKIGKALEVKEC